MCDVVWCQVYKERVLDVAVNCAREAARSGVKRFIHVSTSQVYNSDKVHVHVHTYVMHVLPAIGPPIGYLLYLLYIHVHVQVHVQFMRQKTYSIEILCRRNVCALALV